MTLKCPTCQIELLASREKLKYAEYMRLHKIITGLSIWEMLASGSACDMSQVPDEFMEWFGAQKKIIVGGYNAVEAQARAAFDATPKFQTRKEYAMHFKQFGELQSVLFRMLDGHDYASVIWKKVKPIRHQVFKADET